MMRFAFSGLLLVCLGIIGYGFYSSVAEILRVRHVHTWPTTMGLMIFLRQTIPNAVGVNYYIVVEYNYRIPHTQRMGAAHVKVFRLYKVGHREYLIAYNPKRPEQGLLADHKEWNIKVNVLLNGLFIAAAGIVGMALLLYAAAVR